MKNIFKNVGKILETWWCKKFLKDEDICLKMLAIMKL